jgi:hypothetical protein
MGRETIFMAMDLHKPVWHWNSLGGQGGATSTRTKYLTDICCKFKEPWQNLGKKKPWQRGKDRVKAQEQQGKKQIVVHCQTNKEPYSNDGCDRK